MSLEAVMTRLADLTEQNNDLLGKLLAASAAAAASGAKGASAASNDEGGADETATETKPKTTRAKKADKPAETSAGAGFEISYDDLKKKKLAPWLAEFAKKEDKENPDGAHPEVAARKAALTACFAKLGVKRLDETEGDAKKLTALNKWFETKAKIEDHVGAGAGRFAADPADDADEDGDDDSGDDIDEL